jgi:hypothetical protein
MTTRALPRLLVLLRRIADALDRLAPPPRRRLRRTEFSVATDADFERGYAMRNTESMEEIASDASLRR